MNKATEQRPAWMATIAKCPGEFTGRGVAICSHVCGRRSVLSVLRDNDVVIGGVVIGRGRLTPADTRYARMTFDKLGAALRKLGFSAVEPRVAEASLPSKTKADVLRYHQLGRRGYWLGIARAWAVMEMARTEKLAAAVMSGDHGNELRSLAAIGRKCSRISG